MAALPPEEKPAGNEGDAMEIDVEEEKAIAVPEKGGEGNVPAAVGKETKGKDGKGKGGGSGGAGGGSGGGGGGKKKRGKK